MDFGVTGSKVMVTWSNVPKLFPINNLITPLLTLLKLGPHIPPGWRGNHIDFGVNRSKIKVTRSNVPKPFK